MADPRRFTCAGQGLEAELLRSAEYDDPRPLGEVRLLAALGLAATTVGATALGAAHASTGLTQAASGLAASGVVKTGAAVVPWVAFKWVGGGVLAGALTAGSVAGLRQAGILGHEGSAPSSLRAPAPTPQRRSPAPSTSSAVRSRDRATVAIGVSSVPLTSSRTAGTPASGSAQESEQLSAEVRTLDRATVALNSSQPERALRELNQLERQFPRATLGPEASLLRIEALMATGHRAEGVSLARRFLVRHPGSPHIARVRALLRQPGADSGRTAGPTRTLGADAAGDGVARFSEPD